MVESNETSTHFMASLRLGRRADDAINDRLADFASPAEKTRRVGAGFDEVTFGERAKQGGVHPYCPPMMNEALKGVALARDGSPSAFR